MWPIPIGFVRSCFFSLSSWALSHPWFVVLLLAFSAVPALHPFFAPVCLVFFFTLVTEKIIAADLCYMFK